jgi:gamma-glutamyltranspeptidase
VSLLGEVGYRAEPHPCEFGDLQVVWRVDDAWMPASDPRDRGDARVIRIAP